MNVKQWAAAVMDAAANGGDGWRRDNRRSQECQANCCPKHHFLPFCLWTCLALELALEHLVLADLEA